MVLNMNSLTYEEESLISCFTGDSHIEIPKLIADMEKALPHVDEEMKSLMEQTLNKLKKTLN